MNNIFEFLNYKDLERYHILLEEKEESTERFKTIKEKFILQANIALNKLSAIKLPPSLRGKEFYGEDLKFLFISFIQNISEQNRICNTFNAGALCLLYSAWNDTEININKDNGIWSWYDIMELIKTKECLPFIKEYGITPVHLVRYIKFINETSKKQSTHE